MESITHQQTAKKWYRIMRKCFLNSKELLQFQFHPFPVSTTVLMVHSEILVQLLNLILKKLKKSDILHTHISKGNLSKLSHYLEIESSSYALTFLILFLYVWILVSSCSDTEGLPATYLEGLVLIIHFTHKHRWTMIWVLNYEGQKSKYEIKISIVAHKQNERYVVVK